MTRLTSILMAMFASVGLCAQQVAYSFPYQPIPADLTSVNNSPLPPGYMPVSRSPAQPMQRVALPAPALPPATMSLDNTRPISAGADIGTIIPTALPGYELRVMDVTKRVTFDVSGTPVSAEVPIFIYMPRGTPAMGDASKELRKLYNDLIMLYDKEAVDKERVRSMLQRMDVIIDSFDAMTPTVGRYTQPAGY